MSIYEKWQDLISNQSDESFPKFWEEYSSTEKRIYDNLLTNYKTPMSGALKDLAEKNNASHELFMGFLDGINSSLKKELDIANMDEASNVELSIDFEKLYYNMLDAQADYLYNLPQWQGILGEEKMKEIVKAQRKSKTMVKEDQPGRNDSCPCGSGKKYKKCCGTL